MYILVGVQLRSNFKFFLVVYRVFKLQYTPNVYFFHYQITSNEEHIEQVVSYCSFYSQDLLPLSRFFGSRVGHWLGTNLFYSLGRVLWARPRAKPRGNAVWVSTTNFSNFILMHVHTSFVYLWHNLSRTDQRRSSNNKVTLYTDIRSRKRVHLTMTYHKLIPRRFHDGHSLV